MVLKGSLKTLWNWFLLRVDPLSPWVRWRRNFPATWSPLSPRTHAHPASCHACHKAWARANVWSQFHPGAWASYQVWPGVRASTTVCPCGSFSGDRWYTPATEECLMCPFHMGIDDNIEYASSQCLQSPLALSSPVSFVTTSPVQLPVSFVAAGPA